MTVEIISPDKNIFSGEAKLVSLPGTNGSFEILDKHAPIISTLEKGQIKIEFFNQPDQFFEINGGIVECKNNKVNILVS
ncbi:MAG: ATP synthase F1 subunit epsilon [Bacteroidales bacterium]|nr:ATP synthase F1 subunit epsilon [Bacteroidales bacterium]